MIRAIHNFGPKAGEYVPAASTDIRATFEAERQRIARERVRNLAATVNDEEWLAPRHQPSCALAEYPFAAGETCSCMYETRDITDAPLDRSEPTGLPATNAFLAYDGAVFV